MTAGSNATDRLADDLYDLALADGASDEALAAAAEAAALAGHAPPRPFSPPELDDLDGGELDRYENNLYGAGAVETDDDGTDAEAEGSHTGFTLTSAEMNMTSAERLVAVGMERLASGLNRLHGT